ncbi:hypothetical protein [Kribbella catacumbae]|nr:hypothetical protein [Kribbella catacumbae]
MRADVLTDLAVACVDAGVSVEEDIGQTTDGVIARAPTGTA